MNAAETRQILKDRARALARPLEQSAAAGPSLEVIEFRLAGERYAIERPAVSEVFTLSHLTPLPCTPPFVRGIVNLRGRILPVIDIKRLFDLPESGIADIHQAIVISSADVELGILADSVGGVVAIPLDQIEPTLPTLSGVRERYLRGIARDHTVILDAGKILGDTRLIVDEHVENPI